MNRAGCLALNVPLDSGFGMPWIPLLPESVHGLGLAALRKAAMGETARFPGQSVSPDGMMHWDNLLNPIFDEAGQVHRILVISRDVTEQTRLDHEVRAAANRENLLRWEMQHRVKNLFAIVLGLVNLSEAEAHGSGIDDACALQILRQKLNALSRASDAALPSEGAAANRDTQVDLRAIIGSVLAPYGPRCRLTGAAIMVHRDEMTTFALLLHELATNSVKYGSLGAQDGYVDVVWQAKGDDLALSWTELGGPPIEAAPCKQGFGSEMEERLVASVGGRIRKIWKREGLLAELSLPLPEVHAN